MDTIKKILCLILMVTFSFHGFSKTIKVKILNDRFDPAAISVCEGDTINWSNLSDNAIEIMSGSQCKSDGLLNSGSITSGTVYSYVFGKVGNYNYYSAASCTKGMKGLVMVNPKKIGSDKARNIDPGQQKKSSSYNWGGKELTKPSINKWHRTNKDFYAIKPKEFNV